MARYFIQSFIIISLVLGIWPLSQASQPLPPVERQPSFQQERTNLPSAEERERVRKRIDLIRMWRLTEDLNLDEETGSKLFPLLRQYEEKRRELARKREEILFTLKGQLKAGSPHEDRIKGLLKDWEELRAEEQDVNQKEKEDLKRILSIEQQAKYILFQQEFTKEMRRMIADVRERRPVPSPSRMNIPAKP
jgi:Spy/CpxP family protein refolding chaperone